MEPSFKLLGWLRDYQRADFSEDLIASFTLVLFLVPQGLAYALLAGLSPQAGLYASIVPVVGYALVGSSAALSVGPAALPSLMTTAALAGLAQVPPADYPVLAAALALFSGLVRVALGALRFGFIANYLSASVVGGFVTGSALLILLTQLPNLLGIDSHAANAGAMIERIWNARRDIGWAAPALSAATLIALFACRAWLATGLRRIGVPARPADLLGKAAPLFVIVIAALAANAAALPVKVVGPLPPGLPPLALPLPDTGLLVRLLPSIAAIALIGFIDSYSIAQVLAMKRRETVSPDRELIALGLANVASGVTGGFPVSASFGRSAANELAGARTQLAGLLAAVWMLVILLVAVGLFAHLPLAALSATIVVAVVQLIDLSVLRLAWRYERGDAWIFIATAVTVLVAGVVDAVVLGVALSLALFVWRTSAPHLAELGRVPGTEHYRNRLRYAVEMQPGVLAVRVDESLYFANIRFVSDAIVGLLRSRPDTRCVLLVLSAVNAVDVSALQGLRDLNRGLADQGIALHLAEVKGPVMDRIKQSGFLAELSGAVHLSTHAAMRALEGEGVVDFVI
ncbi:solute carrier family 26 protein [Niveibacterium umoris]|uniref:SulP family sulfate permease n=1 Tax=Niveibacterium umoris TaxID=1193620 RepID=A0A840BSL0_9RHOO|nr:sulfate permease [Niveibacterium umoris]MBB4014662.1 SulP family sulfate permease [Niveibacterium umoris]